MMTKRVASAAGLALLLAAGRAASQTPKAPPPALIDQVLKDTNLSAQVSLALDNGYGLGLDSWDGTRTDIRKQVQDAFRPPKK